MRANLHCPVIGILTILSAAANIPSASDAAEEEQLKLLGEAISYSQSPDADTDRAVELLERTLDQVQLSEPNLRDVQWELARAYHRRVLGGTLEQASLSRAMFLYEDLFASLSRENPLTDWRALDASESIARLYELAGQKQEAENQYLRTRRLCYAVRESLDAHRDASSPFELERHLAQVEAKALDRLAGLYDTGDQEGISQMLRLMREHRGDSDLEKALSARLRRARERLNDKLDALVLRITSEEELNR